MVILLLFALTAPALAQVKLPKTPDYVTDLANIVSVQHKRTLSALIRELNQKAGIEATPYFEATEQAQNEVPAVNFSKPQPTPEPATQ